MGKKFKSMKKPKAATKANLPTPAANSTLLEMAGFWPRLAAIVYESLLIGAIIFCVVAVASVAYVDTIKPGTLWLQALILAAPMVYFVLCWARSGQTLAMLPWRLLLSDKHGKRVSYGRGCARFFVATLLGFGVVGLLWQWFDRSGLALQDRITDTRVLRLPP
jgi:uncharacterized RDD family membrane protein YckC